MKKALSLLLAFLLCLSLSACGSSNGNSNTTNAPETNTSATDPKTNVSDSDSPSQALIQKDLETALSSENEYADITETKIVKSLTEDGSYAVTLAVTATAKYADWQYEVDMTYTQYDQGWMLDDVEWITESYLLMRIPSESEMVALVNEFFSNHESERLNTLAGVTAGSIRSDNALETGRLSFSWSTDVAYKHGESTADFDSEWYYEAEKDTWLLAEAKDNNDTYVDNLQICRTLQNVSVTGDFSGEWSLMSGNTITISNFSSSGFDATWEGNSGSFRHITSMTGNQLNFQPNFIWYTDGSNFLCLQFNKDKTSLLIGQLGSSVHISAIAEITEDLPYNYH